MSARKWDTLTLSLSPSFVIPLLSLYTQEQARTLELEGEGIGGRIGEGKEDEEEKHLQHLMGTLHFFNLIHGELKKSSPHFLDFSPKT